MLDTSYGTAVHRYVRKKGCVEKGFSGRLVPNVLKKHAILPMLTLRTVRSLQRQDHENR